MKDDSLPPPVYVSPGDYAQQALPAKEERPSRLGIGHLLLWVTATAVLLSLTFGFLGATLDQLQELPISYLVHRGLTAILNGAAVASIFVWLGRLVLGGPRFPVTGGHFLLLYQGFAAGLQYASDFATFGLQRWLERDQNIESLFLMWSMRGGLTSVLALIFAVLCFRPARWMIVFLIEALCMGLIAASYLAIFVMLRDGPGMIVPFVWINWANQGHMAVMFVAIIVVAMEDARERVPRDWLYWTGIGVWCALLVTSFAYFLLQMWS